MTAFQRGSEWRKWDLHLHAPGTKLNDGYGTSGDVWGRYCDALAASDVEVFGIADYFSFDGYFETTARLASSHPEHSKLLIPNLELRLTDRVNRDGEVVEAHVLFPPELDEATAQRFLTMLKTTIPASEGSGFKPCADLQPGDYAAASVSRESIDQAIEDTFGDLRRGQTLLKVVAANKLRSTPGEQRTKPIAQGIDAWADAFFGGSVDRAWFLNPARHGAKAMFGAKPVYCGCDAHSFEALKATLGCTVDEPERRTMTTWIKADPIWDGLGQTLVEPDERVRLQSTKPDLKDPYKVISRIFFSDTNDFPSELFLNPNLVSIIGSRSSGKSALLAYVASAIDPNHVKAQQLATGQYRNEADLGPAAGKRWSEVGHDVCKVEWADPAASTGRVIYIPQNSLFSISARPDDITAKIAPALYRLSDGYRTAFEQTERDTQESVHSVHEAIDEWFRLQRGARTTKERLRDLGDKTAVDATRISLEVTIEAKRRASALSSQDVATFERVTAEFRELRERIATIDEERKALAPYLDESANPTSVTGNLTVQIQVRPGPNELRGPLKGVVADQTAEAELDLRRRLAGAVLGRYEQLERERTGLFDRGVSLKAANQGLLDRHASNSELDDLVKRHGSQLESLRLIAEIEQELHEAELAKAEQVRKIKVELARRLEADSELRRTFAGEATELDGITFGFDRRVESDAVEAISQRFNRVERSPWIDSNAKLLDRLKVESEPGPFLEALFGGQQRVRQGVEPLEAAKAALSIAPAIRLYATLDGDRIGGFEPSSMTPGKQALFALTLILSESDEAWPLLIDQPEDDLDSRAIYDTIVPYLADRKRERQILMVTHNPNLVIGADSEQVIVANRHGDDRRNRKARTFAFLTGSLEQSKTEPGALHVLEQGGIREHTCAILDGGEEAFQKRRDKYKMD